MAKGGEYMIHRCSGGAHGNADKMLSAYNACMETDKSMADIYAERTGKTADECMALMKAESWFGAEKAKEENFVDEIITGPDEEEIELSACALNAEEMELMRACYEHAPDHPIRKAEAPANSPISNETSAVAAASSTENKPEEGVNHMELKNATAEQLHQENPALAQSIAQQAVNAERERMQRIDRVTPKGAKYAEMAAKAKADGTSLEDYLAQIVEAQDQSGADYIEARSKETAPANNVGGGDPKDHDDPEETAKKAAKDIADLAKDMNFDAMAMI